MRFFHSSRGVIGSTYQTQDGKHYVRTPWGHRVLDAAVGPSVYGLQVSFVKAITRVRLTALLSGLAGLVVGVLLTVVL